MAVGFDVLVDQNLFARNGGVLVEHRRVPVLRPGDRASAVHAVLLALEAAAVVPPFSAAQWDRQVGLLGTGFDLVEDLLPQRLLIGGLRLDMRILGLEVRDDLWVGFLAHPFIRVEEHVVMVDSLGLDPLGDRRCGTGDIRLVTAHASAPIQSANFRPEIRSYASI